MSFYDIINSPNFNVIQVPTESDVQTAYEQKKNALTTYTTTQRDILATNHFFQVNQLIINSSTSQIQQLTSITYPGTGTWSNLIA